MISMIDKPISQSNGLFYVRIQLQVSTRSGWNVQKATNVFNQQSHVTRDTRGQVEENNQQIFFKVFLFSSESQVSMVAQYGSLASLEQVRIPKFFNFDVVIVQCPLTRKDHPLLCS